MQQAWRITKEKAAAVQEPTAPGDQLGKAEVPELWDGIPGDDYVDESKVHRLLPREMRMRPIGSESNHSVHPEQDGAMP